MTENSWFTRNEKRIARILTIALFLGLIRCIMEIVRLQHYSEHGINYEMIFPFIMGAMIAATGLFLITILSFFSKQLLIVVTAVLTLAAMITAKIYFGL
jgi:hypothetical protein